MIPSKGNAHADDGRPVAHPLSGSSRALSDRFPEHRFGGHAPFSPSARKDTTATRRRSPRPVSLFLAALLVFGGDPGPPRLQPHFLMVALTTVAATAAAFLLTLVGVRRHDRRSIVVGTAFAAMAALLLVYGMAPPGADLPDRDERLDGLRRRCRAAR